MRNAIHPSWTVHGLLALLLLTSLAPAALAQSAEEAHQSYLEARELLDDERFRDAARSFEEVAERFRESDYAAKALYWRAFALYRDGSRSSLREAIDALEIQLDRYRQEARDGDSAELAIRIRSQLAEMGDSDAAEDIARLARRLGADVDEDDERDLKEEEKLMALNALLQMRPERAMPILRKILVENPEKYSAEFRSQAVFLVAQHAEDDMALDLLVEVIHNDRNSEVREQAVFWLGQTNEDRAFELLKELLADPDEDIEIRDKAIFSISQYGGNEAAEVLRDVAADKRGDKEIRAQAIFWLHQSNSRKSADFLVQLYNELEDEELKDKVIFSLSQMGGRAATAFLRSVVSDEDEDVELRKQALFWLGQTSEVDIEALRAIYRDVDDIEMREQVIFVLSQMNNSEAIDVLIEIARSDDDPELREKAVFWIGQSNDDRAADFLEKMLEGEW